MDTKFVYNIYIMHNGGEKLKTIHSTDVRRQADPTSVFEDALNELAAEAPAAAASGLTGTSTVEYHGSVIYRDGKVDMVLFPGGYATVSGSTVTFHYYTQDYLGNNRAVINGSTGAIEQTIAYYPYGGIIADLGNPTGGQPYKFGGKELITANGLNEYDFGARQYYSAVPGFTKPDPMCEKYYWLSPFLYCANNPVNLVDPTGKDSWTLDSYGNLMNYVQTKDYDEIMVINKQNEEVNVWKGDYGSLKQLDASKNNDSSNLVFRSGNDATGLNIFEFLADHSFVEWSVLQIGLSEDNIENIITTSHKRAAEAAATEYIVNNIFEIDIRYAIHSHPSGIEYPSGLDWNPKKPGDVQFAGWVDSVNKKVQAIYKIYNPMRKSYIEFNQESTNFDFLRK